MRQYKTWSAFMMLLAWVMLSFNLQARNLPDFTDLVADNGDAVVNISTRNKSEQTPTSMLPPGLEIPEGSGIDDFFKKFFEGPNGMPPSPRESESLGSGFVLSDDGYILTNHHVIRDAEEIIVRFSDRTEMEAELLGSDERSDVALIKVDATGLKSVKLGDSNKLKVGEWVLAIGSPFGFDYSATAGIVSALGRSLPSDSYVPFIQTDVAINPGNSGGPLFNLKGEVIGINSQIYSRTGGFMGVSFAIPIDTVMNVVAQIKDQGYVSRGWLGVVIQDVTRELAESFGLNKPRGALVSRVVADSPAAAAGFKAGDVILEFDGKDVEASSDLPPIVGRTMVGKEVDVRIMRDNKRQTLQVSIEELPEEEELASNSGKQGRFVDSRLSVEVADIKPAQRDKLGLETGGVIVTKVEKGPAINAGVRPGDVILSLNNVELNDAHQFVEVAKELPAGKPIPILIQRNGESQFLALKIAK
ncbi:Serine protease precursor MucD/AlgY associated with sigma factor RpoE [Methylophaga thiooxydans]|uniref:Probable periplasmic serine endoprotease DegP-like n=2 Tax=Methylophaga thiooxydans TaxID=392484 RepID=C0N4R9_9GAMM|nr:DegQ family serine endoprotease [Methylophaga thiooxydans]EEF80192.1 protease Do subfamily [Methylophaga thiooxydans DMS010]KGM06035.1 Serine protease precursor MucD/AlgY associated with sigma factor RpoE [Methylophaga thiooxydans]